jgi:hypothetical protein
VCPGGWLARTSSATVAGGLPSCSPRSQSAFPAWMVACMVSACTAARSGAVSSMPASAGVLSGGAVTIEVGPGLVGRRDVRRRVGAGVGDGRGCHRGPPCGPGRVSVVRARDGSILLPLSPNCSAVAWRLNPRRRPNRRARDRLRRGGVSFIRPRGAGGASYRRAHGQRWGLWSGIGWACRPWRGGRASRRSAPGGDPGRPDREGRGGAARFGHGGCRRGGGP